MTRILCAPEITEYGNGLLKLNIVTKTHYRHFTQEMHSIKTITFPAHVSLGLPRSRSK